MNASIKKQASMVAIGKIFAFLIQLSSPIILVRIFTPSDYGLYQQILTISIVLIPLIDFSLKDSLYYFHPRESVKRINSYITQAFYLPLVIGSVIILFVILTGVYIIDYYNINLTANQILLVVCYAIFFASTRFIEVIFIVEQESISALRFFIIDSISKSLFVLAAAFFYKSIYAVLIALVLYTLIEFIFLFFYLRNNYNLSISNISLKSIKAQFKYSLPMFFSALIGKIGANSEKLILILLLTTDEFAIYTIGSFRLPFIVLIFTSVGNVILPKISKFNKEKQFNKAFVLWKKMVLTNSIFTIPFVVFFFVIAEEFITLLFTADYVSSVTVFRISILVLLIQMMGYGYLLRGFAETKSIFYANLTKTIFSIIAGYFFIRYWGVNGAAVVFVITFSINAIMQLWRTKRVLKISLVNFLPWRDFIIITVMSIFTAGLISLIKLLGLSNIAFLIFTSLVYFPIMLLLMLKFHYISAQTIRAPIDKYILKQ